MSYPLSRPAHEHADRWSVTPAGINAGKSAPDRAAFERDGAVYVTSLARPGREHRLGTGQDPTLTPDGRLIAFEEDTPGVTERHIAVCDAASGRVLGRRPGVEPRISPDGRRLAFSLLYHGAWTAWMADRLLPVAPARMLAGTAAADGPAWICHWTGGGLLIVTSNTLGGSLYAIDPPHTVARMVRISQIAGGLDTTIPIGIAWSDNLSRVVFEVQTDEELHTEDPGRLTALFLYDFPLRKRKRLTPPGVDGTAPVWYGRDHILFTAMENRVRLGRANICRMNVQTGVIDRFLPNASNITFAQRPLES